MDVTKILEELRQEREQLEEAIAYELGAFGSHGGDPVGITYQGSGLRIWADRCLGSRNNPPMLQGHDTVAFARRVYGTSGRRILLTRTRSLSRGERLLAA